ncbi:MAG: pilus assembly protein PilM [Deltaproteobacteria bacterium]|nr:pilus assembly protein PilM [Deltaproteobacteria bacterium]
MMSLKVLGLDMGDSAVKAVLVARSMAGRSRILAADVIPVDEDGGIKAALDQLFKKELYGNATCVVSLPAKALSYRSLQLPFRDKKKIEQTIAYELDPMIQSSIDDVYYDYVRRDESGGSSIFAAMVSKTFLDERLRLLAGYVKHITAIEADAVVSALKLSPQLADRESYMLLDIGITHTVAVFLSRGRVLQMRYFNFGATLLTERAARFIGELKNTMEYLIWQGILETSPTRLFLTGGGALVDGIEDGLEDAFSIPLTKLDFMGDGSIDCEEPVKKEWRSAVMNQALALATRSADQGSGFNFKRRVTEATRSYDEIKKDLRWIGTVVLFIICLGLVDVYMDYRFSQSKLDKLKQEVITEFKKYSPETTRIVEPISQLKVGIDQAKKITAGISTSQSEISVLGMLKEVSTLTPASVELLIRAFNFENGVVSIKGQTKNFDSVDAIKNEIAQSKYFKSVTIGATNLMKQGDKVEFDLRIEVR